MVGDTLLCVEGFSDGACEGIAEADGDADGRVLGDNVG